MPIKCYRHLPFLVPQKYAEILRGPTGSVGIWPYNITDPNLVRFSIPLRQEKINVISNSKREKSLTK